MSTSPPIPHDPAEIAAMLGPEGATPAPMPPTLGGSAARVPDATEGAPPFINRCLDIPAFRAYVAAYDFGPLPPSRLVLHHTVVPSEAEWRGLPTMRGMQSYYHGLGWGAGPHLYAAPDGIWLATPLYDVGIHAGVGNGSVAQGWYSIGLELVGDFDHALPGGAVWANAVAAMAALALRLGIAPKNLIRFHRDYSAKTCPGTAITKAWVWDAVEAAIIPAPVSLTAYGADSPLLGVAQLSAEQAAQAARLRGSAYPLSDLRIIAALYWRHAAAMGLNADLCWAQCLYETGNLSAWWAQRPRRNPAGLGVTGVSRGTRPASVAVTAGGVAIGTWARREDGRWAEGLSFPDWEYSVQAHLGRLRAYATSDGGSEAQRAMAAFALACRPLDPRLLGSAPTLAALGAAHNVTGRGWAVPGADYGARIADVANALGKGTW
jgi:hypothetical protein